MSDKTAEDVARGSDLPRRWQMADPKRIVVIGGGLAGAKGVEALRSNGYTGSLTLVSDEADLPYERPPLSKDYLQGKAGFEKAVVHPAEWYQHNDVDLRRSVAAMSIDRDRNQVQLADGTVLGYDKLLLATGAIPRKLELAHGRRGLLPALAPRLRRAADLLRRGQPRRGHRSRLDRPRGRCRRTRRRHRGHPRRQRRPAAARRYSGRRWARCSPSCTASTVSTCASGRRSTRSPSTTPGWRPVW